MNKRPISSLTLAGSIRPKDAPAARATKLTGKAGDAYRELVGVVMRSIDPGSVVKTEQWIDGPDGERDMDVELRGTRDGKPFFALIECKDHGRRIGIGYVDAFESKARDLKPDSAIMFSNSGFTPAALAKAKRVGIQLASALMADDDVVKVEFITKAVALRQTFRLSAARLFDTDTGAASPLLAAGRWDDVRALLLDGASVLPWFRDLAVQAALGQANTRRIEVRAIFKPGGRWSYLGQQGDVGAISFEFAVANDWVCQLVKSTVSIGSFDHHKQLLTVAPAHALTMPGPFDLAAWKRCAAPRPVGDAASNPTVWFEFTFPVFLGVLTGFGEERPAIEKLLAARPGVVIDLTPA